MGLSAARAYKRFYPAVDPLISWSRYLEQLKGWYDENLQEGWSSQVQETIELLKKGDAIEQMMQVTGEEGITLEDYITFQKSLLVDMVYLQQDAFDKVDVSVPIERQMKLFTLLQNVINAGYKFGSRDEARSFFLKITGLIKNLNYSVDESDEYAGFKKEIDDLMVANIC